MITHYLKITFRNILKNRTQSLVGIFGLAFGLSCLVLSLYWLRYEMSFDSFHPDAKHIYRIYAVEKQSGKVNDMVQEPVVWALREQFPATSAATGFYPEINICSTEKIPYIRMNTLLTDNSFFSVFPQLFVSGDIRQPLQSMYTIVLTETMAIRLFGNVEKAIGQQIQSLYYYFYPPYTVTAVVKDPPPNTGFSFDAIIAYELVTGFATGASDIRFWNLFNTQAYVKLHSLADVNEFAEQIGNYTSRLGVNDNIELRLMNVSAVRHGLNTNLLFTMNFMRLFVATSILLIFSASFCFLSMHFDLFRQRIHEFRLRKVHGAKISQLVTQMLFELACSILLSFVLACCLVVITRPVFSSLLGIEIGLSQLIYFLAVYGTGLMGLMGLICYFTSWRLNRFVMQHLSERKITVQPLLRRITVTLQLAVSVLFIVASLVVMMQIRYVNNKDLGFEHNSVIQLSGLLTHIKKNVRTALIHELEAIPQIQSVTTTNFEPQHNAKSEETVTVVEWPGKPSNVKPAFNVIPTDSQFAETLGLKMIMGRWWNEDKDNKIVLNEEAVRIMELGEPVGTIVSMSVFMDDVDYVEEYEVVGVVKDFHTLSLRSRILPTIFRQADMQNEIVMDNILYINVLHGNEQEAIRRINMILPGIDDTMAGVRLTPINELYDRLNHSEQVGLKMFSVLATVCLLISLFGIFAAATVSTQHRRKEIAIRKVVGAQVSDIIRMFFRNYILQVIIADIVALPLAYFVMHRWLQAYAYRTNIPWWLFAGVIATVIIVVLLTVLGQILKAAYSNPAAVIKAE